MVLVKFLMTLDKQINFSLAPSDLPVREVSHERALLEGSP